MKTNLPLSANKVSAFAVALLVAATSFASAKQQKRSATTPSQEKPEAS